MQPATASPSIRFGSNLPKFSNKTLWISIALGLIAAIANLIHVRQIEGSRITVLKAKAKILAGTKVTKNMFDTVDISGPLDDMSRLVVKDGEFQSYSTIPLAESLEPGQILLQTSFNIEGGRQLRDVVCKGDRAVTLSLKSETAGPLKVGNQVDIYKMNGDVILSNVRIVALGGATTVPVGSSQFETISVTIPENKVPAFFAQLQQTGDKIRISLVGPGDEVPKSPCS